jgi:hypothetical protein
MAILRLNCSEFVSKALFTQVKLNVDQEKKTRALHKKSEECGTRKFNPP